MTVPHEVMAHLTGGNRRSGETTIAGRRWRLWEPPPRRALEILTDVGSLLGPELGQFLAGAMVIHDPECPKCGNKDLKTINEANGRWSCVAKKGEATCRTVWDKGPGQRMDLAYLQQSQTARVWLAGVLTRRIQDLDGRELVGLAERVLPGHCEFVGPGGTPVVLQDPEGLDTYLPNGPAIVRLLACAAEAWILPSLVDGWTDTPPASSTAAPTASTVQGASEHHTMPSGSTPAPPGPQPSGTRAPPPTRRHG